MSSFAPAREPLVPVVLSQLRQGKVLAPVRVDLSLSRADSNAVAPEVVALLHFVEARAPLTTLLVVTWLSRAARQTAPAAEL